MGVGVTWEDNACVTCGVRFGEHPSDRWRYCMGQSVLDLIDKHITTPPLADALRRATHERMWEEELEDTD